MDLSYQSDIIAVGLQNRDIIIFDAITGSEIAVLSGHIGWVMSIAFSVDGRSLVSESVDKTVNVIVMVI